MRGDGAENAVEEGLLSTEEMGNLDLLGTEPWARPTRILCRRARPGLAQGGRSLASVDDQAGRLVIGRGTDIRRIGAKHPGASRESTVFVQHNLHAGWNTQGA